MKHKTTPGESRRCSGRRNAQETLRVLMDEDDAGNGLRRLLDSACIFLTETGAIKKAPSALRDYWGKRRAKWRKEQEKSVNIFQG